jgi:hypothetical protein
MPLCWVAIAWGPVASGSPGESGAAARPRRCRPGEGEVISKCFDPVASTAKVWTSTGLVLDAVECVPGDRDPAPPSPAPGSCHEAKLLFGVRGSVRGRPARPWRTGPRERLAHPIALAHRCDYLCALPGFVVARWNHGIVDFSTEVPNAWLQDGRIAPGDPAAPAAKMRAKANGKEKGQGESGGSEQAAEDRPEEEGRQQADRQGSKEAAAADGAGRERGRRGE